MILETEGLKDAFLQLCLKNPQQIKLFLTCLMIVPAMREVSEQLVTPPFIKYSFVFCSS